MLGYFFLVLIFVYCSLILTQEKKMQSEKEIVEQ